MAALVFAVHDCGFRARSSLEESDSSRVRLDKIRTIIADCRFGIHDISRTELDADHGLPRGVNTYTGRPCCGRGGELANIGPPVPSTR